jgi:aspartate racemase
VKRLGIIGGIGPESTVEYYRQIISAVPAAPIVINSIDVRRILALAGTKAYGELEEYLLAELAILGRAGVSLALIAANTPHVVFDAIVERAGVPLLSIVDAACEEARTRGFRSVGLLGTRATMQGNFYPKVFARAGIDVVTPTETDQAYVHDKYVNELLNSEFLPETRDGVLKVIDRLRDAYKTDAVILAGTELPLLLPDSKVSAVPLLDTTRIHVAAAIRQLWSQ